MTDISIKNILGMSPHEKHLALKGLTAEEINWLYQEDPFDAEIDLQLELASSFTYAQAMQDSINFILKRSKCHGQTKN
jgi:hypothetical protein